VNRAIRCTLAAVLAAASLTSGPSAASASGVPVRLEVSVGHHSPPGPLYASCEVTVPAGADGLAVLDAAVASGCISSYETSEFAGFGRYVACIDAVCQVADGLVSFWALFYEDAFAETGIEGFEAAAGRQIELTYTTLNCWVGVC